MEVVRSRSDRRRPLTRPVGPSSLGVTTGLALVASMAVLVGVIGATDSAQPTPVSAPWAAHPAADEPAGCPAPGSSPLPLHAQAEKSVVGDLDGDTRPDRFLLYEQIPDPGTVEFLLDGPPPRMRVELATGEIIDLPTETLWRGAMAVGVADVNDDGRDEVVIDPRNGATGFTVDLVAFVGCRPRPVTAPDGTFPVLYYYQNSSCCIGEIVGVECADVDGDSHIELVTIDEKPSGEWSYDAYHLEEDRVVPAASGHGSGPVGRPAALHFSGGFDCDGFRYG